MGAPQVSYSTSCLTPSKRTYLYAQVLPYFSWPRRKKKPLDNFQLH